VPNGKIRSSVLLIDCGFRDNPFPFDTFRLSQRMPLSREDGGTGAAGYEMIKQLSSHPVHQRRCIEFGRS
jgi:hypothetical protein